MMFHDKSIVLDTNILIRAVLGEKVRNIIQAHADRIKFYTPALCFQEAEYYLPQLFKKRGLDSQKAIDLLENLSSFIYEIEMIFLELDYPFGQLTVCIYIYRMIESIFFLYLNRFNLVLSYPQGLAVLFCKTNRVSLD